jgi:predicted SAM-dependent methyltransferase
LPKSKEEKPKLQVLREHYFENYDTKERWMSYWYQINEVFRMKARKVLEVGIGNKTVSNYLKERGIEITTVDIDPSLNPDYVCSVTDLSRTFKPRTYDAIICAEVLEHLPFKRFRKALRELHKVSREWVLLSLPYAGPAFCLSIKLPRVVRKDLKLKIPSNRTHKFDGEHYWEIGKKGYPLKKILKIFEQNFDIVRTCLPPEHMYHIFFALKKKGG